MKIFGVLAAVLCAAMLAPVPAPATAAPLKPLAVVKDCPQCPGLVVIPKGSFQMGAREGETFLPLEPIDPRSTPRHKVTFAKPFAIAESETTRAQFAAFVADTNYQSPRECAYLDKGNALLQGFSWKYPTIPQYSEDEPVLCTNYYDALAYADWLSKKTGKHWRLPSEAEWEYAARAGTDAYFAWGDDYKSGCHYAAAFDLGHMRDLGVEVAPDVARQLCDAGLPAYPGGRTPVKMYKPNAWGLYGIAANGWEAVADCWHKDFTGAPTDGSAWNDNPNCNLRTLKGDGGALRGDGKGLTEWGHVAHRYQNFNDHHRSNTGTFRLARDLEPGEIAP